MWGQICKFWKKRHCRLIHRVKLFHCANFFQHWTSRIRTTSQNVFSCKKLGQFFNFDLSVWGKIIYKFKKNAGTSLFQGSGSSSVSIFVRIGRVILKWQTKMGICSLLCPLPLPFDIWSIRVRSNFQKRCDKVVTRLSSSSCHSSNQNQYHANSIHH